MLENYNIKKELVHPAFLGRTRKNEEPLWLVNRPNINITLSKYKKDTTSNREFQVRYRTVKNECYNEWFTVYTDGSKCESGVGAAFVAGDVFRSASLPHIASIFSAELYAIKIALSLVGEWKELFSVIFCDS